MSALRFDADDEIEVVKADGGSGRADVIVTLVPNQVVLLELKDMPPFYMLDCAQGDFPLRQWRTRGTLQTKFRVLDTDGKMLDHLKSCEYCRARGVEELEQTEHGSY